MPEEENTHPSGVADGTVLETTTHDGQPVKERVVHGPDGTWSKEVVS